MDDLSEMTDERLADDICTWAGRVAAGMAQLLRLVAEFDRREAWGGPGLLSCAHWLSWRIGLSPGTAREWVRVARRLQELPQIAAAFHAGRISWSQARAITRVATTQDGIDWVDLTRHSSAAQLERIVRGLRRVRQIEEAETDPDVVAYRLRTRKRYDADGNLALTIYASAEDAPVILAGFEAQRAELERQRAAEAEAAARTADEPKDVAAGTPAAPTEPGSTAEPEPITDADVLTTMARRALDAQQTADPALARRHRARLVAQIDPLSGWGRLHDGELLPPASLKTVLRSLPGRGDVVRLRPLTDADLTRHDLGRRAREVNQPLRELLGALDGERCRFPGCTRHRKLHAHHVVYWSDGGVTDLSNLVLLCSRHHTLVHAQGFRLVLHPDRRLDVTSAQGTAILHHPGQPWGDPASLDPTGSVSAGTLPPTGGDARMDLGYVVSVLLAQSA